MEPAGLLVAVCGLSLLCVVGLGVFAFFTGRTVLAPVINFVLNRGGDIDVDEYQPKRKHRMSGRDFQARAQSLDFDSAVARHSDDDETPDARKFKPKTPPLKGRPGADEGSTKSLRRGSGLRKNRDRERDPDEIYDFFDDEEGGDFI